MAAKRASPVKLFFSILWISILQWKFLALGIFSCCRLMPIPSASSKIFWPCSNYFDCVQYFLNMFKFFWLWSKVIFYLINLHIWAWSKLFDHIQIYWTRSKSFERSQFCFWTSKWIRHKSLKKWFIIKVINHSFKSNILIGY